MSDAAFIRKSLFALGGLLVWAAHFTFVYGFNTMACARRFSGARTWGVDVVTFAVSAATVVAAAAVVAIALLALWRRGPAEMSRDQTPAGNFLRYMTVSIALLSLVAIIWTGAPAFIVEPCGPTAY